MNRTNETLKHIKNAYVTLRQFNNTIPDEVIDFIIQAAREKLDAVEFVGSGREHLRRKNPNYLNDSSAPVTIAWMEDFAVTKLLEAHGINPISLPEPISPPVETSQDVEAHKGVYWYKSVAKPKIREAIEKDVKLTLELSEYTSEVFVKAARAAMIEDFSQEVIDKYVETVPFETKPVKDAHAGYMNDICEKCGRVYCDHENKY